jgi:hypothetical protein
MFASQFNKKRQQWSGELASAGQTLARHMLFVFCVVDRMRILLLMFDIYWSRDRRCSAASNLPLLTCGLSPITSKSARHYRAAHTWIRPISILLKRRIQENCRNSIIDPSGHFFLYHVLISRLPFITTGIYKQKLLVLNARGRSRNNDLLRTPRRNSTPRSVHHRLRTINLPISLRKIRNKWKMIGIGAAIADTPAP